jgi:hypothetical protein
LRSSRECLRVASISNGDERLAVIKSNGRAIERAFSAAPGEGTPFANRACARGIARARG